MAVRCSPDGTSSLQVSDLRLCYENYHPVCNLTDSSGLQQCILLTSEEPLNINAGMLL